MQLRELETKALGVLGRYASLDFESLKDLVLGGGEYSYANEELLKDALKALTNRGVVKSGGKFGPFWLATASQPGLSGGGPLPQAATASSDDPGRPSVPPGRRRNR